MMNSEASALMEKVRLWLSDHPLEANQDVDVHWVPAELFQMTDADDRLKALNHQIKGLPLKLQKLLLYLAKDTDPSLIIESLEYASPELFWLDKAVLVKEVDPKARQQDVLQVFEINARLLDRILETADEMDREAEKVRSRKIRRWSILAGPLLVLLLYLFVYPLVFRPSPTALFEKFRSAYRPDWSRIDTTAYEGSNYYDAVTLLDDGDFAEAAALFEELVPADSLYRIPARWFLALINLHSGDRQATLEQLKAIRFEDPDFYKKVAEELDRKL
jgi:hypothetical protein